MKPIIEFKNFSFKYRSQKEPTIKDINLAIYPGEKVLIVGPSGSGKSTLAHCINGLVPFAYKGEITGTYTVNGQNPLDLGIFGLSKLVGTVLQDTDGQFIGLTVAEDIAFALENDEVPQPEMFERVAKVAETVEVQSVLGNAPGALSGGQKQRVSMAGVMIDRVDILLFDEPLANLDPATGKRAIELIDQIHRQEKTTVVIIEHRLEDALTCGADRIIVVGEGRIVADMTPDELLSTDILQKEGIREPLYVTALKYAGCRTAADARMSSIESMKKAGYLEQYQTQVREWFRQTHITGKEQNKEVVLEVKNLDFAYTPGKPVLQNVSFQIHRGEMLAIVGKNGAGKSTLSNLICGFLQPDNGSISLNGEDILTRSIKERGESIGLVMQNPNQMISKTMIFEEVALGLQVRGVPEDEIEKRVHETLKICGLYPFRNWPISALSYGQKKRVTIASILVMNPDIIILDEPTAGQDYRHYTEIMEFLEGLNRDRGITIVMITHDMHLMLEYTDRALVIAEGQLLADKRPSEILTDDVLTQKAYLKRTSLYDLAVGCGIDNPSAFVDCFIYYERENGREIKGVS
ncbi:MAG: ABC transporter ATP-binding protein [Bacillus sp. (in: Bacteria)]|nr:ABC transporter ATP-binding protein [Bacillus sp. (in: firmicutes)]MCM1425274.1 ABC transporter ATP-binding protein [Eubacterium sp.]